MVNSISFSFASFFALVCLSTTLVACGGTTSKESEKTSKTIAPKLLARPDCQQRALPTPVAASAQNTNITLARELADAWIQKHPPGSQDWDWGPAVMAYALTDLYEQTHDPRYKDYVQQWHAHWQNHYPLFWSDHVPPVASAVRLAAYECQSNAANAAKDMAQVTMRYLLLEAPRTADGGISHLGNFLPGSPQLWVDSLFMFGSYLMAYGQTYAQTEAWDVYAEQITIFVDTMQDESGWFRHAWVHEAVYPTAPVFWGRGNGWIASIVSRFLEILPREHPQWDTIAQAHVKLLQAVIDNQDPAGLWWTVTDKPGATYLEVSASALFVDGLYRAANLGLLPKAQVQTTRNKALAAIKRNLVYEDNLLTVDRVSGATQPAGQAGYHAIQKSTDIHYGVGSVIMALLTEDL